MMPSRLAAVLFAAALGFFLSAATQAAATEIPPRVFAMHDAISGCEARDGPSIKKAPVVAELVTRTAILAGLPCFRSGKNTLYKLYIVETGEIGGIHPVYIATYSTRFGWMGSSTAANIRYDAANKRLESKFNGRRENDCGAHARWVWKDYAFALENYAIKRSCKSRRWTTVYPPR